MKISAVKTLIPAPKDGNPGNDSVTYYLTASMPALTAYADGNVKDTGPVTITQWKKVGKNAAQMSSEMTMALYLVDSYGDLYGFGTTGEVEQQTFDCSDCNGYLSILAELSDDNGNVVFSLAVPIVRSGADSIVLDLSNENDSMLYDGEGNLLSGNSVSAGRILAGGADVTSLVDSDDWSLQVVGATATQTNGVITVTGMTANSATAELSAVFNGRTYKAVMTLKKLVGVDKYELLVTPNAVTYNRATGKASASEVNIKVYRTGQNGERTLVQNLADYDLSITYDYNNESSSNSGSISEYSSGASKGIFTIWDYYRFYLRKGGEVVDHETVPISSSSDAVTHSITDGGSYFRYDPNTQAVAVRVKGWLKKTIGTSSTPVANSEIYFDDDRNCIKTSVQGGASFSNSIYTDSDGHFDFTLTAAVDGLSDAVLINVGFYLDNSLAAAMTIHKVVAGVNGEVPKARYSADKESWHEEFTEGDIWMQLSLDGGNTWGEATRVVGEKGLPGTYVISSFNLSKNLTSGSAATPPANLYSTTWHDAPIEPTKDYPYLWCKQEKVDNYGNIGTPVYFRITGEVGEQGPQGPPTVTYRLKCTPAVVTYNPNNGSYSADYIDIVVQCMAGDEMTELTTGQQLADLSEVDGIYYINGTKYYLSDLTDLRISLEDFLAMDDRTVILYDWDTESIVWDSFQLTVVRQGMDGTKGKPGKFYYYAGKFVADKEYKSTENQAPYVDFDWEDTVTVDGEETIVTKTSYYVLIADTNVVDGSYVKPRTTAASGVWELMETSFKFILTEAMFTAFGKLGSAVFSGDWMISQHGAPGRVIEQTSRVIIAKITAEDYTYLLYDEYGDLVLDEDENPVTAGPCTLEEIASWAQEDILPPQGVVNNTLGLYADEQIVALTEDACWGVDYGLTAEMLLELDDTSYEYFGWTADDPHAVWHPNLSMDMLTGKIISYDMDILGVLKAPIIFHSIKKVNLEVNEAYFASLKEEIFKVYCLSSTYADAESHYYVNAGRAVVFIPTPDTCEGKVFEFVANGAQTSTGNVGFYVRTFGYDAADLETGMAEFYVPCVKNGEAYKGYLRIVSDGEEWTVISHIV